MGEIILVAGVNYPKFKHAKSDARVHYLEHGAGQGEFLPACLRYVRWVGTEEKDQVFVLFNVWTGRVTRFKASDVGSRVDFNKREDVNRFELAHVFARFRAVDPGDYRAVIAPPEKDKWRLVPVARTMTGFYTSSHYVPYFEGVTLMGSKTVDEYRDDYNESFNDALRGLSITDIYEYIITGSLRVAEYSGRPNLVKELHVFSHSWREGPILVNSSDGVSGSMRDESDRDGRLKDFGIEDVRGLDKAFEERGYCVQWGCVGYPIIREAIKQVRQKPTTFQIVLDKDMDAAFEGDPKTRMAQFHDWFGGRPNEPYSVRMNCYELAQRIDRQVSNKRDLYVQRLAEATARPCYSLPPAATSDFDDNPKQKSVKLMHASKDELDVVQFFKRYFPLKMDLGDRLADVPGEFDKEVGRGYMQYIRRP